MSPKALITGITGQDGSYLTELLLEKGYEVHGIIRRASSFNTGRIDHLYKDPHLDGVKLFLNYGDLTDSSNLSRMLEKVRPDDSGQCRQMDEVAGRIDETICPLGIPERGHHGRYRAVYAGTLAEISP